MTKKENSAALCGLKNRKERKESRKERKGSGNQLTAGAGKKAEKGVSFF